MGRKKLARLDGIDDDQLTALLAGAVDDPAEEHGVCNGGVRPPDHVAVSQWNVFVTAP